MSSLRTLGLSLSLSLCLSLAPSALAAAPKSTLLGRYTCALQAGDTRYPAMPCTIAVKKAKDGTTDEKKEEGK